VSARILDNEAILIVDDEPVNLKLLDRMLGGQGYGNLVLVEDPREVLECYRRVRPALILRKPVLSRTSGISDRSGGLGLPGAGLVHRNSRRRREFSSSLTCIGRSVIDSLQRMALPLISYPQHPLHDDTVFL
jgi:hypothetical protein